MVTKSGSRLAVYLHYIMNIHCYRDGDKVGGDPRGVVVNVPDCDITVSVFKLQSCFLINTLGKGMNNFIPMLGYGLNRISTELLQGWLWHYITHES